jgi:hypothetical protein
MPFLPRQRPHSPRAFLMRWFPVPPFPFFARPFSGINIRGRLKMMSFSSFLLILLFRRERAGRKRKDKE